MLSVDTALPVSFTSAQGPDANPQDPIIETFGQALETERQKSAPSTDTGQARATETFEANGSLVAWQEQILETLGAVAPEDTEPDVLPGLEIADPSKRKLSAGADNDSEGAAEDLEPGTPTAILVVALGVLAWQNLPVEVSNYHGADDPQPAGQPITMPLLQDGTSAGGLIPARLALGPFPAGDRAAFPEATPGSPAPDAHTLPQNAGVTATVTDFESGLQSDIGRVEIPAVDATAEPVALGTASSRSGAGDVPGATLTANGKVSPSSLPVEALRPVNVEVQIDPAAPSAAGKLATEAQPPPAFMPGAPSAVPAGYSERAATGRDAGVHRDQQGQQGQDAQTSPPDLTASRGAGFQNLGQYGGQHGGQHGGKDTEEQLNRLARLATVNAGVLSDSLTPGAAPLISDAAPETVYPSAVTSVKAEEVVLNQSERWNQIERSSVILQLVEKARLFKWENNAEIVILLKPEALGRISLRASVVGQEIVATIAADSAKVKNLLEFELPVLHRALQQDGIPARIEVIQGNDLSFAAAGGGASHSNQNPAFRESRHAPGFAPPETPQDESSARGGRPLAQDSRYLSRSIHLIG